MGADGSWITEFPYTVGTTIVLQETQLGRRDQYTGQI